MNRSPIKRIVAIGIILIFFFFIGKSLYQSWHTLEVAKIKLNFIYLGISYLFMFLTFFLVAYTWKRNLSILKEDMSFITALRINALSTIPKYAPGKIWGIIGKVYLAKKEGISEHACFITISLETILYTLGGIIFFLFTGASILKGKIPYIYYLCLIPICLLITYPPILIRITNIFLKLFKRSLIDFMPNYLQILELLLLYTMSWLLQGIGVYFLINSFYSVGLDKLFIISGLHAFSWVVGFVSLITPAGLGVKESVLTYFLTFLVPSVIAILASLIIRVWGTIGEIGYFIIFLGKIKKYL